MEEIFTLSYIKETKEFILEVNKDLMTKYGVSQEEFKEKINYEILNSLKNNLISILRHDS